jgi:hypothetical protein
MSVAMKATDDVDAHLDEIRDWRSLEEVVNVSMNIFDRFPPERSQEVMAFSFALRSVERVLDAQKQTKKQSPELVARLESALISRKSIREIALMGVAMALAETVNIAPDGDRELMESRFRIREQARDVFERRAEAMDALRIIVSKLPRKSIQETKPPQTNVGNARPEPAK